MTAKTGKVCQRKRHGLAAVLGSSLALGAAGAGAQELSLVVQPIQSPEATGEAFEPLAEYLSEASGHSVKLVTARNFVAYWETMKKGDTYDLILDAAHLTDYRIKRMGYTPLAKVASVVSFALVTHEDNPIFEPRELIGKPVAAQASPSIGAVRLAQMFPNPLRQPVIVRVSNSGEAAQKVRDGEAAGALIPTPMVGAFPYLYTVQTTPQIPHMALSASPRVPEQAQRAIRNALVNAGSSGKGRQLLDHLRFQGFEPASPEIYEGYARLLQGVYGY